VDVTDNELAYLEGIHLFVEMLDRYFGNVCELDLVFNFHKVREQAWLLRAVSAVLRWFNRVALLASAGAAGGTQAGTGCRTPPYGMHTHVLTHAHTLTRLMSSVAVGLVRRVAQVYAILDEYIIAGELQETSALVMLDRVKELEKMLM
jgi:hypothetical protein